MYANDHPKSNLYPRFAQPGPHRPHRPGPNHTNPDAKGRSRHRNVPHHAVASPPPEPPESDPGTRHRRICPPVPNPPIGSKARIPRYVRLRAPALRMASPTLRAAYPPHHSWHKPPENRPGETTVPYSPGRSQTRDCLSSWHRTSSGSSSSLPARLETYYNKVYPARCLHNRTTTHRGSLHEPASQTKRAVLRPPGPHCGRLPED